MKMKTTKIQNLWDAVKTVLRIYTNTSLPWKIRKISNNLTLHLKQVEKDKQNLKLVVKLTAPMALT